MMNKQLWSFAALDTLFFKESRPMEAVGGSELASVFPPPARTLIGAIRTAVGESHKVDWAEYGAGSHPLRDIIGAPDSLGPLRFTGPYLLSHGERLFPVPCAYLQTADGQQTRLTPAKSAIECDLGKVRLPIKMQADLPAKPLENAFLTFEGLQQFLSGKEIDQSQIRTAATLFAHEERLGIGRDNSTRTTGDGLLYQTRHIRPLHAADLQIGMTVSGLQDPSLPEAGMVRLGAEGRLAAWQRGAVPALPVADGSKSGLLLVLLTPALFAGGWLPDGFAAHEEESGRVWLGELAGIRLKLISSVVGKPVREGGWDMVRRAPRPLLSYAPGGSCYFCEVVDGDIGHARSALHGIQLGQETEYGRGEIAVGYC